MADTKAMMRGRILEPQVLKKVAEKTGLILEKSGLLLNEKYPIFGASPDAITEEYVVEVKCPTSRHSKERYISSSRTIGKKVMAQIQLQMAIANRTKSLLCVADENFEKNGEVEIIPVDFDKSLISDLVKKAEKFWIKFVFQRIAGNYTQNDDS